VLGILAIIATIAVVGVSLTAYTIYRSTLGSIHRIAVAGLGTRPKQYNSSENILVIGAYNNVHDFTSQTFVPSADNGADTYVLVHISPDHKGAVLVSFPRDAMVPVYDCPASAPFGGQTAQPGALEPLNQSYADGGPGCVWHTLEQQTGIFINHFTEVDYLGFEKFVAALGGADVCLPYAVNIPNDGLHLKAGMHHITPAQALKFVRARDIGQWSDLQRIKRQQFFMISVMQSALHQGLLGNPLKLLSIAHQVAPYLVTDSGLGLTAMASLAGSMHGVNLSKVQLIEVPTVAYPPNPQVQVIWQTQTVAPLFSAIAHDRKVPPASTHAAAVPSVSPSKVKVEVLNGSKNGNRAPVTASRLASRGFIVTGTGNAASATYTSPVIEYSTDAQLPAADTLAMQITGVKLAKVSGLTPGTLTLILGSSFHKLAAPAPSHTASPVGGLTKTFGGVTGNTNICKDQAAFSG
jgi:LCP family protein required for cell wall assembly